MISRRGQVLLAVVGWCVGARALLAAGALKPLQTFEPHGSVQCLAFSPDDKTIACGTVDGHVWQWETQTGKEVQHFKASDNWVLSICFSSDGKHVLTGEGDGHGHVWDLATQKAVTTFNGTAPFRVARFYNNDQNVVTCDNTFAVRTWDATSGNPLLTMEGHTQLVGALAVSPDGTKVYTGSADHTERAWNLKTGAQVFMTHFGGEVESLAVSPDGATLYSAITSRVIRTSDATNGKLRRVLKDPAQLGTLVMDISPDGNYLLTATYNNKGRLLKTSDGSVAAVLRGHQDMIWAVAFSHDGHYGLTGGGGKSVPPDGAIADIKDDAIRLWDFSTVADEKSAGTP